MQQYAAALEVLEEADTEACPFRCAFNQPRDIGNYEALFIVHTHHAQAWHQGGKRIVSHFRLGGGDRTDEGGFAGVRHAQHPDIGQQHQLQLQVAFITRGTHGFLTRRTVNGRFETGVAQTVPAAFRHHQTLTVFGHIAHGLAGALVDNPGADRHFYRHVFTTLTGTVAALAILPTFGAERFFKTVVDQGVQVLVRFQPDIAAITAIAAVRTAFRNILFAAEAYATIAAVTCYDQDRCFIYKLHFTLRKSFA